MAILTIHPEAQLWGHPDLYAAFFAPDLQKYGKAEITLDFPEESLTPVTVAAPQHLGVEEALKYMLLWVSDEYPAVSIQVQANGEATIYSNVPPTSSRTRTHAN